MRLSEALAHRHIDRHVGAEIGAPKSIALATVLNIPRCNQGASQPLAAFWHPSICPTPSAPESRSAAEGSVFWLPDQPSLHAFPAQDGPVASNSIDCAARPRLQRRARAGFSPASRRSAVIGSDPL